MLTQTAASPPTRGSLKLQVQITGRGVMHRPGGEGGDTSAEMWEQNVGLGKSCLIAREGETDSQEDVSLPAKPGTELK